MAVDKELLARYKELKAQGINVSLSELKAQLAAEKNEQHSSDTQEQTVTENYSTTISDQQNKTPIDTQSTWTTNYYTKPVEQTISTPTIESYSNSNSYLSNSYTEYSNNFEEPATMQTSTIENYSQSAITYEQPIAETYSNTTYTNESSTIQNSYCGNITNNTTVDNSSYTNNFNADFSWQSSQPEQTSIYTQTTQTQNYTQITAQSEQIQQEQIPTFSSFMPQVSANIEPTQPTEIQATKFCLIGYPLGHSLSSYIHNAGFKSLGLDYQYEILETSPENLVDRIKYLKYNNFAGFNVTIPLKLPVTLFLNEIDASADIIGAVNTVVIRPDKTMKGYNTDVIGFINAIPQDFILAGKVAGILGTGGAARAAITALAQNQVKEIKIFTRNIPNSIELLNFLRKKFPSVEFNAFQIERIRDLSDINILVNTTPIGMQGRAADMTPVEENELRTLPQGALVYDVIYNPKKTVLLKLAEKYGYKTINGVDMFIHQAVAAEQIWTGRTPDFKDMKIAALENL